MLMCDFLNQQIQVFDLGSSQTLQPTPARIAFSFVRYTLEAIHALDKQSGNETTFSTEGPGQGEYGLMILPSTASGMIATTKFRS